MKNEVKTTGRFLKQFIREFDGFKTDYYLFNKTSNGYIYDGMFTSFLNFDYSERYKYIFKIKTRKTFLNNNFKDNKLRYYTQL